MANPPKGIVLVMPHDFSLQPYQRDLITLLEKGSMRNMNHTYGKLATGPLTYPTEVKGKLTATLVDHKLLANFFAPKHSRGFAKHIRKLKAQGKMRRNSEIKRMFAEALQKRTDAKLAQAIVGTYDKR